MSPTVWSWLRSEWSVADAVVTKEAKEGLRRVVVEECDLFASLAACVHDTVTGSVRHGRSLGSLGHVEHVAHLRDAGAQPAQPALSGRLVLPAVLAQHQCHWCWQWFWAMNTLRVTLLPVRESRTPPSAAALVA